MKRIPFAPLGNSLRLDVTPNAKTKDLTQSQQISIHEQPGRSECSQPGASYLGILASSLGLLIAVTVVPSGKAQSDDPALTISRDVDAGGEAVEIKWEADGVLQSTRQLDGEWNDMSQGSPARFEISGAKKRFFRLKVEGPRAVFDWSRAFVAKGGNVVSADFNQDNRPDLAIHREGETVLLLNEGNRNFEELEGLNVPAGDRQIVADFDGDGAPDLLNSEYRAKPDVITVSLARRLGYGGGFKQGTQFGMKYSSDDLTVGDFNGDDVVDLIVGGSEAFLYSGKGDGTFEAKEKLGIRPYRGSVCCAYLDLFTSGDFNGDGAEDLVAGLSFMTTGGVTQMFLGNGDGSFQEGRDFHSGRSGRTDSAQGDFNGDGITDLATAFDGGPLPSDRSVRVTLGDEDEPFPYETSQSIGAIQPVGVAVDDLNGDGFTDIAIADQGFRQDPLAEGSPTIKVVFGDGEGNFHNSISYKVGVASRWLKGVSAGDFDGDGLTDLVVDVGHSRILWNGGPAVGSP